MENILRRLLPERIELRLQQGPLSGPIKADPHQMQQVVMNLAINARDAMPAGGTLTVALDEVVIAAHEQDPVTGIQAGPHARITVADTGVGMDQETRTHLFEPFFTTKPLGQGAGLGLATVHGIINQSGGHIRVRSAPGQGTSFQILLPAAAGRGTVRAGGRVRRRTAPRPGAPARPSCWSRTSRWSGRPPRACCGPWGTRCWRRAAPARRCGWRWPGPRRWICC